MWWLNSRLGLISTNYQPWPPTWLCIFSIHSLFLPSQGMREKTLADFDFLGSEFSTDVLYTYIQKHGQVEITRVSFLQYPEALVLWMSILLHIKGRFKKKPVAYVTQCWPNLMYIHFQNIIAIYKFISDSLFILNSKIYHQELDKITTFFLTSW